MATEEPTEPPEPSLGRYLALATPLHMANAVDPAWQMTDHHREINYQFCNFVYEENDDDILIITAPPRHGKSAFLSQWAPVHYLGRNPTKNVILCSYGKQIAQYHSRIARDWYHKVAPLFDLKGVNRLASAASDWRTLEGGGMLASGVTGGITGRGGHLILIDDYLRSAKDAMSPTMRESQWEWFTATVSTRREPNAKLVILATPWHREDLIGTVMRHKDELDLKVRLIRLEAIYSGDEQDPMCRQPGEALWPQRWPVETLRKQEKLMGPYWWQAQYMGNPGLYGDSEWPEEYFEEIFVAPDDAPDPEEVVLSTMALDPSKGKTDQADYQAMVYAGFHRGTIYVDARLKREPVPRMIRNYVRMCMAKRPLTVGIESNQFQELLAADYEQACIELGYQRDDPVEMLENTVNKFVRILRLGAYLHGKMLKVIDNPGGRMLVEQLKDFPNGEYDDGPDALEMAIRMLAQLAGMQHGDPEDLIMQTPTDYV